MTLFAKTLLALGVVSSLAAPAAKAECWHDYDHVSYGSYEPDCFTHMEFCGYNQWGQPIYRRVTRCQ
jgi:hypothetical protein